MTLQLDARQRAMLEEMGIKLFWPEPPAAAAAPRPEAVTPSADAAPARPQAAPARTEPRIEPRRQPVPAASGPAGASLDWDALQQAVAEWAAGRRRKAVFGAGDVRASWLCVGDPPVEEEERQGQPFVGDPGKLLDNMLAAVGASRQRGAYLTNVMKCRLPDDRGQEAEELAQSMAFLQRQVELLRPRVILAMGRTAVQGLLQTGEPIGKLRGRLHHFHDVPVVVTYHPAYLLRNPPDKARAWADLCLARAVVEGAA
jgi:uracil-DNA glycosylase